MVLDILYQDDYLLVVNKPPGLVVTPSETSNQPTMAEILHSEYGIEVERGGVVHRLDKDTSGVILVAKTAESFEKLQNQFRDRTTEKEYICLVQGVLEGEGVINQPIGRNPLNREKFVVLEGGRESVTHYQAADHYQFTEERLLELFEEFNKVQTKKLLKSGYGKFTFVRVFPKTGRTHQIRVHLKHQGFPIVGDEKYGGRKVSRWDHRWCERQFLHAQKLSFNHPVTGKRLSFTAPLPPDLEKALSNLEVSG